MKQGDIVKYKSNIIKSNFSLLTKDSLGDKVEFGLILKCFEYLELDNENYKINKKQYFLILWGDKAEYASSEDLEIV